MQDTTRKPLQGTRKGIQFTFESPRGTFSDIIQILDAFYQQKSLLTLFRNRFGSKSLNFSHFISKKLLNFAFIQNTQEMKWRGEESRNVIEWMTSNEGREIIFLKCKTFLLVMFVSVIFRISSLLCCRSQLFI